MCSFSSLRRFLIVIVWILASAIVSGGLVWAQGGQPSAIPLKQAVVIGEVGRSGRMPFQTDAVVGQIVSGQWSAPRAGDVFTLPDASEQTWTSTAADDKGWLPVAGYASWQVSSAEDQTMILEATGHSMVYVNGRPRIGDHYRLGAVRLPVAITAGENELLFRVPRRSGRVKATLLPVGGEFKLEMTDSTLPDLLRGSTEPVWAAVLLIHAANSAARGLSMRVTGEQAPPLTTSLPPIAPMSTRKIGFPIPPLALSDADKETVTIELMRGSDVLASATITLAVRDPGKPHKRTFISNIDGSVQYYAVTPAAPEATSDDPLALILSCHGAGVEASGQAAAYRPKTWCHIVAPTNRRRYGFDWEDWGRLDAMEVLAIASRDLGTDPLRTYLTGHSMGGHGTWHLGVTFPGKFAAIGPSAGWVSFWSYAGAERFEGQSPIERMFTRATAPGDTLALVENLTQLGVFILHGDRDDNVPVEQARTMRERLGEFHPDFAYHEQPGAGHWWGNKCVDWPPMMAFFKDRARTPVHETRRVRFTTANPGVSATCDWATIEAQQKQLAPASIDIRVDPVGRTFTGTTKNVARLSIDLAALSSPRTKINRKGETVDSTPLPSGKPLRIELDGGVIEEIPWPESRRISLIQWEGGWQPTGSASPRHKGPHRYGPFKDAFRRRMMFVYGTIGSDAENEWSFAKARFDAETFWYRGNGSIDVIADVDFDPAETPDRNVIVYGHAQSNRAWTALLGDSPVQIRPGEIIFGDKSASASPRRIAGEGLSCLMIRPRPGSDVASVGVVSGTGIGGMRSTDRLPYFVSGVAYPDCVVFDPSVWENGIKGVLAAGFFGLDWTLAHGDFAWASEEKGD